MTGLPSAPMAPTARERLLARYADPSAPPFPGAVALACCECARHLTWTNPPPPPVPTACAEHDAPGRLVMDDYRTSP